MLLDRSPYFPRFVQFHLSFSMCDAKWIILTIFTYIIIYQNQNVTDLYTVWFITLMKRTLEMSNGITIYSNSLSYYKNRLTFISRINKNLWYPIFTSNLKQMEVVPYNFHIVTSSVSYYNFHVQFQGVLVSVYIVQEGGKYGPIVFQNIM